MNKDIIKVISICIGLCGMIILWNDNVLPGLIVLSVACLGGMVATSKNVIGN
jgi:hypothetical protein